MKTRILLLLLLASHITMAQQGNYFLSHYSPTDERIDYLTFGMVQDAKGVVYFANKNGVLEFDGRNWGLVSTSGPMFTITTSGQNVFVGGQHGFGKLVIGADNTQIYQSLSNDQPDANQIFSSVSLKNKVYFLCAHAIFVLARETGKIEFIIKSKPTEEFTGLLEITDNVYVKTSDRLLRVDGNKLIPPNFPWPDNLTIEFSASSAGQLTLLSVHGGRLFLASATGLKEINLSD